MTINTEAVVYFPAWMVEKEMISPNNASRYTPIPLLRNTCGMSHSLFSKNKGMLVKMTGRTAM